MATLYSSLLTLISIVVVQAGTSGSTLPYKWLKAGLATDAAHVDNDLGSRWWTRVGDRVYHAPDESSGLSRNIENYYYAMGSQSALTEELRKHRVGGDGRWHIFHLPTGPTASMLEKTARVSDRRSSMSTLHRLQHGAVLSTRFPEFIASSEYQNPLSASAQELERQTVELVTKENLHKYLVKLTDLGTRSYSNAEATQKSVDLLHQQFQAMGMTSCTHTLGQYPNVIGFAPGSEPGTVVVGAHYDSRPFDGKAPGAEDNGSGVAAMLAMAKAFQDMKVKTKKSVYFVAFAAEEPGLLGSHSFATDIATYSGQHIPDECKRGDVDKSTTDAIIMDEVGWVSPKMDETVNLEAYDWTSEVMQHLVHSCQDHNGNALKVVHNGSPFGSDHMSFLNSNMKAVLTINGDDEAYPNYHSSTDTIENVDSAYAARIAKMNMGALLRMAGVQDGASMLAVKSGSRKHRNKSLRRAPTSRSHLGVV